MKLFFISISAVGTLAATPQLALAHPEYEGAESISHEIMHVLGGSDHQLPAMLAAAIGACLCWAFVKCCLKGIAAHRARKRARTASPFA